MDKIAYIRDVLECLKIPQKQQSDLCVLTILGLAQLKKNARWSSATNAWMRIHDIIAFLNANYDVHYAENSRETFRKAALHHFRYASIVEDNRQATNSPNYKWRLTDDFLAIIHSGRANKKQIQTFLRKHSVLQSIYTPKKNISKIPITINGNPFELSKGKHNQLQKAIIEEFASRFAKGSECLYVGDTTKKDLFINDHKLQQIGFNLSTHNTLPDIILYDNKKQWLYFIEAVTSVGPMDAKRVLDITKITKNVNIGKIFVTAFPDMNTFKRFSSQLAWDTEVWIAEYPDHMIHLNGDRFIGPR